MLRRAATFRQAGTADSRTTRTAPRRGTVVYLVAIVLPVFLIFVGFLINITYLDLVRTDLRIATDAAAHAAAHVWVTTGSREEAISAAQDAAARNVVAGRALSITEDHIEFGTATRNSQNVRYMFQLSEDHCNAVRVTGDRSSDSPDGPIPLIFPGPLGRRSFEPTVATVAAQMERDIVLIIDRSRSLDEPLAPSDASLTLSRWEAVQEGVALLCESLATTPRQEHLALVSFGSRPELDQGFTVDYDDITSVLGKLSRDDRDSMGYAPAAFHLARATLLDHRIARPSAAQVIVLVTDGYDFAESQLRHAVHSAVAGGQVVFLITLDSDADQTSAAEMARIGLGQHFHASNVEELRAAMTSIAEAAPTILAQ